MRYVIDTYVVRPPEKKPMWPWVIFAIIVAIICASNDKKKDDPNAPVQNDAPAIVSDR